MLTLLVLQLSLISCIQALGVSPFNITPVLIYDWLPDLHPSECRPWIGYLFSVVQGYYVVSEWKCSIVLFTNRFSQHLRQPPNPVLQCSEPR